VRPGGRAPPDANSICVIAFPPLSTANENALPGLLSYSQYKQITSKKQRCPVYHLLKPALIIKNKEQKKTDSKSVQGGLQRRLRNDRVKNAEIEAE